MASSNSQIDKPQRGHPKRAELPDININTGVQSINTESLFNGGQNEMTAFHSIVCTLHPDSALYDVIST